MEMQQYYAHKWKSIADAEAVDSDDASCKDGFDCNICLEFANEPVVTLCGHLYCWPCIYKWLRVQSASLASDHSDHCPQCPVCKTEISHATMVPLYGRGSEKTELKGKAPLRGIIVPPRPSGWDAQALVSSSPRNSPQLSYRSPYQNQQYGSYPYNGYEEHSSSPLLSLSGSPHPMAGQIGEMVYARVFGNSESLYAYPNSYHLTGSSSPRIRRHEMQAEKSLNRICIFLFCCLLLCLVVF